MIADLRGALYEAMANYDFVEAMLHSIGRFGEYRDTMPFAAGAYTRTRLQRNAEFEIVAMLWAPGSRSPIHDHGDSRCWVVVLDGNLDVENFERLNDGTDAVADLRSFAPSRLTSGAIDRRSGPKELHRVSNSFERAAYSLQLYAAPLGAYTVVDDRGLTSLSLAQADAGLI
ncbi:MAG TPA: cysteine dioxygenase family protein [Candidatus Dormibacteraeota bacterium]|nr:cysteine dioxygenase family protein [Candidatus Dormibacteraeota bacterium]